MLPYWILFSVLAFGAVQSPSLKGSRGNVTPMMVLAAAIIALMIGLRYHVGGDWTAYERIFYYIGWMGFFEALTYGDPGYSLLNWIVQSLGMRLWAVNLVCAAIFTWGLIRFAARQSNPWLTIVVAMPYLILVVAMGYTRQAVAIGILLAGLAVVDKAPIWRFAIYTFVAILFHKSAIVVLPIVALSTQQSRLVTVGIMLATAVMLYYVFVQSSMDLLVTNYIDAAYEAEGARIRVAMSIVPAVLYLWLHRRFEISEQQRKMWRNFSYGSFLALFFLFALEGSTAVDRLALYLIPLQLFVLGNLPVALNRGAPNRLTLTAVIAYSLAVQFVWLNYAQHAQAWIPYRLYPVGTNESVVPPI